VQINAILLQKRGACIFTRASKGKRRAGECALKIFISALVAAFYSISNMLTL